MLALLLLLLLAMMGLMNQFKEKSPYVRPAAAVLLCSVRSNRVATFVNVHRMVIATALLTSDQSGMNHSHHDSLAQIKQDRYGTDRLSVRGTKECEYFCSVAST